MVDITAISAVLGSLKQATDIAKIIYESRTSLDKAEVAFRMSEIIYALAEAKTEMAEIKEMLVERESRISELERAAELRATLTFVGTHYVKSSGSSEPERFCQPCWDGQQKLCRLSPWDDRLICMVCSKTFDRVSGAGSTGSLLSDSDPFEDC